MKVLSNWCYTGFKHRPNLPGRCAGSKTSPTGSWVRGCKQLEWLVDRRVGAAVLYGVAVGVDRLDMNSVGGLW